MINTVPFIGEIFSLGSAVLWAIAVIIFKRTGEKISPLALNPFKNLVGLILFTLTCIIVGEPFIQPVDPTGATGFTAGEYWLLAISGGLGIGLADTIFLKSLNILGAGISAIVDCMYSAFVIFFAYVLVGERLNLLQFTGAFLIVGAILFASFRLRNLPASKKEFLIGIGLGITAMALMAGGIVMIKPILNKVSSSITQQFWLAGYRLVPGVIVSISLMFLFRGKQDLFTPFKDPKIWPSLILSSVLGTFLAMIMWIGGMALTKVSIAGILNQTSTVFIFIFAGIFLKEPITPRRTVSLILAVAGVYLVFIGRTG